QRHTLVEAEQWLSSRRLVLDHDRDVRHRIAKRTRQRIERLLRALLEVDLRQRRLFHVAEGTSDTFCAVKADEGYVAFRGYRTWYGVVGDLGSGRAPLLTLHGGPGSTHHYFAPLEQLADERASFSTTRSVAGSRIARPTSSGASPSSGTRSPQCAPS